MTISLSLPIDLLRWRFGARSFVRLCSAVVLLYSVPAESAAQNKPAVQFEVASVRRASDNSRTRIEGGPGTSDPERIYYERVSFRRLLCAAYNVDYDQISGPGWLESEYFTVQAKIPHGSTKGDVMLMWQALLAERFHLKVHIDPREFPVYELVVAKGGPKLHISGPGQISAEPGFPMPQPGQKRALTTVPPRNLRGTYRDYSMAEFTQDLRWPLAEMGGSNSLALGRVVNKTGLTEHYDFSFEFAGWRGPSGAVPPPLPDGEADTASYLFDALRQQLGLNLEKKKAPLDVIVVEHADRVPVEN